MKKTMVISILVLFLGFAPYAIAATGDFVPLAVIPGLTDIQPTAGGLVTFFNNLYKYLIGLSAALAVIMIIWGGLEISTQDSISKQGAGKEKIQNAIFGLVLVLSPVIVFSIINPSILNLSLNLEPLDTLSGSPSGGTIVAPVSSGNLLAPNGAIIGCANNDCTTADNQCRGQAGITVISSDVVCMTGGNIDTQSSATLGASSSCPAGETKQIQCVTQTLASPTP